MFCSLVDFNDRMLTATSPDKVLYFIMDLSTSVTRGLGISLTPRTTDQGHWDSSGIMKDIAPHSAPLKASNLRFQM